MKHRHISCPHISDKESHLFSKHFPTFKSLWNLKLAKSLPLQNLLVWKVPNFLRTPNPQCTRGGRDIVSHSYVQHKAIRYLSLGEALLWWYRACRSSRVWLSGTKKKSLNFDCWSFELLSDFDDPNDPITLFLVKLGPIWATGLIHHIREIGKV